MSRRGQAQAPTGNGEDIAERAEDSAMVEGGARWGLAARGVLYLVIAALAVQIAAGKEKRADKQGALQEVARQPLGRVLLVVLAVGLGGYALWRFLQAIVGPPGEDDARKAAVKRMGFAARGILYAGFFASALKLVVSVDEKPGSASAPADWTARALGWPAGPWLVGALGVAIAGGGFYVGWRALSRKFSKRLKTAEMGRVERRWILGLGAVGMMARSVVTVLAGLFLVAAALLNDPGEAVGVDGVLKRVAGNPLGPALLVVVAAGLAAYGLYSFAEARYRRI